MNGHRRPDAPRLIEWTGERCVPWAPDVQVVYEHLHRYMWAAQAVEGMRVLDLASGEGFGAAILAERAASVVGIDIDPQTVEHSRINYASPHLEFAVADALDLSRFPDDEFDAVVAFEMVEHVDDHDRLLDGIRRVLRPGGLLVMSTPDQRFYRDEEQEGNPYHVHELALPEFRQLLSSRFSHVRLWGQRTIAGSMLRDLEPEDSPAPAPDPEAEGLAAPAHDSDGIAPPARTLFVEREDDEWHQADPPVPVYLVALASDAALPALAGDSVLADPGLGLVQAERQRALRDYARDSGAVADPEISESNLLRELARRDVDLAEAQRQIMQLREAHVSLERQYARSIQLARRMEESVTWRAFQSARARLFAVVGGEDSRAVRTIQWALRALGGQSSRGRRARPNPLRLQSPPSLRAGRLQFPHFEAPDVSVVIPVFRRADLTRRCLASILDFTAGVSYEVILVDDVCDEANRQLLHSVDGARVITNPENLGYLRSVNLAAAAARGRWLVLANNDIEAQPGWLQELVGCGESAADIAVVTPQYLYPDGRLNEAGGIIWSDGTGANYGRGDDPQSWRYQYRREVDYGSAAALLVRRDFWVERGGYDETFRPMYYEDTDLCFDAREHGLRVMYEPAARVIHHEGGTAGTDPGSGYKRHQEENRLKFVAKWASRLQSDHLPPGSPASPRSLRQGPRPHVLIVDHRVPTADRDSGSLRMQTIIEILRAIGCRVTLLPDNLHAAPPYADRLRRLGVAVISEPADPAAELIELGPTVDVAILSRPHVASRWLRQILEAAPGATTVYDTVDLHWLREARRYWHEQGLDGVDHSVGAELGDIGAGASALRDQEIALVRATDVTWVVSDVERERVEADVPDAEVHVVPNVHRLPERVPPRSPRTGLLFVGGFEHTPNIEAVMRLVTGVMPHVWRDRPDLPVMIVGPDPPEQIQALASSRVTIAGWVPDLEPLLDSAVALLAPLSYGAGVKGKVTQAMAAGLPVITTPTGAEGLGAIDGQHLLIGEDDEVLAKAVIRLLDDVELWERLSMGGRELIAERYSTRTVRTQLEELLASRRAGQRLRVAEATQA